MMDEARRQFEEWWNNPAHEDLRRSCAKGWGAYIWQASRQSLEVVAYLTHHGDAVTPGDFAGGAEEMHETAKREGWRPLAIEGDE